MNFIAIAIAIAIASVMLLLLAVAKGLFPNVFYFLPLGGSTVSEMGIVFGLAVAVATIADLRRQDDE
ncbi:hypothetical protein [Thioclava sp. GXIMD4215]|uniref:hypothetical protein n=1 Tax=Thioclava sp. GXIMD4215 TaxID=3131928 RepID=UPI00324EF1A2